MIDTHCHLDDFAASGEVEAVVARAKAAGVTKMMLAGTQLSDWPLYQNLAEKFAGTLFFAAGFHPENCTQNDWREQLSQLEKFVPAAHAIGEIGLDFHYFSGVPADEVMELKSRQFEALRMQLALARERDLPVIIHARDAFDDCVKIIDESGVDWRKVVFHCFSETPERVRELNSRGGRASFTGTITYKNAKNVRDSALAQGLDLLMLETDSPYLAPCKLRGKRCEPAFVAQTAGFVAELFGVPVDELDAITTRNAEAFFGI